MRFEGFYTGMLHACNHFSKSFVEGPNELSRVGSGDVESNKALIDSQVFGRRVRAAHRGNPAAATQGIFALDKLFCFW